MADVITTGAGSGTTLAANVKPDIEAVLKVLEPYQRPFTNYLLLSKKKSKVVESEYAKFEWMEQSFYPHKTAVSAAISASTTLTLTASNVADKSIFNLQDIVKLEETGEMAYVSSVTGGGGADVVLTHMDGSSALTSLTVGTGYSIRIIGTRTFEFGGRLVYKALQEVEVYNYLNEFKKTVRTSGRQQAGKTWSGGKSHADRVKQATKELQLTIERYFFFANQRGYATSDNERTTWGYGLDGFLSSNVTPYTGTLTEKQFRSYLKPIFEKGSGKKIHFCGTEQMDEIQSFMNEKYTVQQTPKEMSAFKEYGYTTSTYRMFSGSVTLVWNPVLDGNATYTGYTVDEENVMLRHMANDEKGSRKFRMRDNTQDPDINGKETEILSDVGLEVSLESTHGKLYKTV